MFIIFICFFVSLLKINTSNMKTLKTLFAALLFISLLYSCNSKHEIEGTWIREVPTAANDTIFIGKVNDKLFSIEAHAWNNGELKSLTSTATFKENVVYLDNEKTFFLNEEKQFVINNIKYIKLD